MDRLGFIMDVEGGECSEERLIGGVQEMIDDGTVWALQGYWGRLAARLIETGLCHRKGAKHGK